MGWREWSEIIKVDYELKQEGWKGGREKRKKSGKDRGRERGNKAKGD